MTTKLLSLGRGVRSINQKATGHVGFYPRKELQRLEEEKKEKIEPRTVKYITLDMSLHQDFFVFFFLLQFQELETL